jgi:hypothetical protein
MAEQDRARWTKLVADFESSDLTQPEFASCCRAAPMTAQGPISREQRDGEWRSSAATNIAQGGNWRSRWVMVSTAPRRGHRRVVGPGDG